ncbi:hypothetical protein K438DRAFT_1967323 [Mycena galopus ATCC 62051]|nr:hypothetical protein K438DRAFT_1967323 [Mycena galopus ATCC 62051]
MHLPISILVTVILALPTFTAPISNVGDEFAIEMRAAKVAAKKAPAPKPAPVPAKKVAAPATKPAPVPAKKPAPVPPKPAPVSAKPAAKPAPVPAEKPAAVAPKTAAPVSAKSPVAVPAENPVTTSGAITSCPVPPRKPAVRRFLEYIGLVARSSSAPACAGSSTGSTSTPATAAVPPKAKKVSNKTKAKQAGKAKAAAASAAAASASASASAAPAPAPAAPAPPVVLVQNAPKKAVSCQSNVAGQKVKIPAADITRAVGLARTQPIQDRKNKVPFPHVFSNFDGEVTFTEPACLNAPQGTLLEYAVGRDMTSFQNIVPESGKGDFGQFRVVITTPAADGSTTFCGVMTHGTIAPKFEKNLCPNA